MQHNTSTLKPVVDKVEQALRQRIMHHQYPEGSLLPSERALADEFCVSRMSISRALERLAADAIVEQRIGAGTRVCMDATGHLPPGVIAILYRAPKETVSPELTLILQGTTDTLDAHRFAYEALPVLIDTCDEPPGIGVREKDLPTLPRRYGGFLFIEGFSVNGISALQDRRIPLVIANLENEIKASATFVNHRSIACSAVEILAALGHRHIGLVATRPGGSAFYGSTVQGYKEGLRQAGLPFSNKLISLCASSDPAEAYAASNRLFKKGPCPTAIVAGRDLHAAGVCQAARERKWIIGRDLSIIGFDDTSWKEAPSLLTTFHEPCYELGAEAALMLINQMQNTSFIVNEHREIPAPLILRRSAGPPADAIRTTSAADPVRLQHLQ